MTMYASDDDYYEDEYTPGYGHLHLGLHLHLHPRYGHTGDPNMDRMEFAIPEPVKKFLQYFQDMIKVVAKQIF